MEILATFADNHARDRVFSCGPKLAGYREANGRPTCGLRLHIPGHLMAQFKILENFSNGLRSKHGPAMRKHIKFDEESECLFVQVKHDNDKDWVDFSVEQARAEREKGNESRAKNSFLFKSPTLDSVPGTVGGAKRKERLLTSTSNSNYTPAQRSQSTGGSQGGSDGQTQFAGSWRPPTRDSEME